MANTNPVTFDRFTQIRSSPEFRAMLEEMKQAGLGDQATIIRKAVEEKYAKWKRRQKQ